MIGGRGERERHGEEAMRKETKRERKRKRRVQTRTSEERNRRNNEGGRVTGGGVGDTVARVYRELWLSLVSIPPPPKEFPCVHRREEAPVAQRGCAGAAKKRRARGKREATATGRGQELTWKRM